MPVSFPWPMLPAMLPGRVCLCTDMTDKWAKRREKTHTMTTHTYTTNTFVYVWNQRSLSGFVTGVLVGVSKNGRNARTPLMGPMEKKEKPVDENFEFFKTLTKNLKPKVTATNDFSLTSLLHFLHCYCFSRCVCWSAWCSLSLFNPFSHHVVCTSTFRAACWLDC